MIKYVHARMPGRELLHLIEPTNLRADARFPGRNEYVVGAARTLCGKRGDGWIVDGRGERCPRCRARR